MPAPVILRERLTVITVARWRKRKCFTHNGIEPRRPKNLLYESALKIGFELKQKKTDRAFGKREILCRPVVAYETINFEVGLLRMTYFNT
jgi:hypothetical protein